MRGFSLAFARVECSGEAAERVETGAINADSPAERAAAFVDSLRTALSLPGMSATVVQNGNTVLSRGFGLASIESARDATPTTGYRVGSVGKLFTAVALMRLVEQGRVDLDAPLSTYFTPYPSAWPAITPRQLAGHTSVRHYRGAEYFSTRTEYAALRDAKVIFDVDTVLFAPGTRYSYRSYGYNSIGATMEAITGEDFPVLLERLVFAPLGMTNTMPDLLGTLLPGRATLYDVGDAGVRETPADNLSSRWPSGGYLSTTEDLSRFASAVLEPGFLSQESLDEVFTRQRITNGDTTNVGIGWRIGTDSTDRRYYHHGGSSNGGSAFLAVYPDENLIIAMASNAFSSRSTPEALRLAALWIRADGRP